MTFVLRRVQVTSELTFRTLVGDSGVLLASFHRNHRFAFEVVFVEALSTHLTFVVIKFISGTVHCSVILADYFGVDRILPVVGVTCLTFIGVGFVSGTVGCRVVVAGDVAPFFLFPEVGFARDTLIFIACESQTMIRRVRVARHSVCDIQTIKALLTRYTHIMRTALIFTVGSSEGFAKLVRRVKILTREITGSACVRVKSLSEAIGTVYSIGTNGFVIA
jgi:hypothetical protein